MADLARLAAFCRYSTPQALPPEFLPGRSANLRGYLGLLLQCLPITTSWIMGTYRSFIICLLFCWYKICWILTIDLRCHVLYIFSKNGAHQLLEWLFLRTSWLLARNPLSHSIPYQKNKKCAQIYFEGRESSRGTSSLVFNIFCLEGALRNPAADIFKFLTATKTNRNLVNFW